MPAAMLVADAGLAKEVPRCVVNKSETQLDFLLSPQRFKYAF